MMLLTLIAIFCGAQLTVATAKCNADNCYRAVAGSAFTSRHASADCSSCFQTTVTSSPVTVTSAQTVTSTATIITGTTTVTQTVTFGATTIVNSIVTVTGGVATVTLAPVTVSLPLPEFSLPLLSVTAAKKRGVNGETSISASIPAYASPCSGVVRYSSACSCLGVTATTVNAPASTVTITAVKTVTVTTAILATSSVTVTSSVLATSIVVATSTAPVSTVTYCANALPTFAFQGTGLLGTSKFAVLYGTTLSRPANASSAVADMTSLTVSGASIFSLNAAGNLLAGQLIANADFNQTSPSQEYLSSLYFTSPDIVNQYGYSAAVCQISASNQLTCSAGLSSSLEGCGTSVTGLLIGNYVPHGCSGAPFFVVPVCVVPATSSVLASSTVPTTSSVPVASSVSLSSSVLITSTVLASFSVSSTSSVQITSPVSASSSVLATSSVPVASSISVTSSASVSTLTSCPSALPTFTLAAYDPEYYPVLPFVDVAPLNSTFYYAVIEDLSNSPGSILSLNAAGNLLANGRVAAAIPSLAAMGYSQLYFVPPGTSGILPAVCQIASNNTLSCSAGGEYTALIGCGTISPVLALGSVPPENCYYEFPIVHPSCVLANSSVSTTSTAPASTVTACANALPTFIIEDLFFGGVPHYGILYAINSTAEYVLFDSVTLISQASIFSLNAAGNLFSGQLVGVADPGTNGISGIFFVTPDTVGQYGNVPVTCQILASNLLSCTVVNSTFPLALDACGTSIQTLGLGSYSPHGCFGASYFYILPVCSLPANSSAPANRRSLGSGAVMRGPGRRSWA